MVSGRILIGAAAAVAAFIAVANTHWSKVVRETQYDGGVQKEHLILGKFRLTSMATDARVEASKQVAQKFAEYGLPVSHREHGVVTVESSRVQYWLSEERKGDIRQESARLAKEMPWLKQAWHGTRFTSFYARGMDPKRGGFVEVMYGRLPERKHGKGMLRASLSISE